MREVADKNRHVHDFNHLVLKALALVGEVATLCENTTETEREFLRIFLGNDEMTTDEIAQKTGKLYPQVCSYLNRLEGNGVLISVERSGSRKKKYYSIVEKYVRPVWALVASRENSILSLVEPFKIEELYESIDACAHKKAESSVFL